jgi:integrase
VCDKCHRKTRQGCCTGLRISELLAPKWEDVDFENLCLSVTKCIWRDVVGHCKTEASRKPVPLDSFMAGALWRWKQMTAFNRPQDWVFASPYRSGRQPYGPKSLLERHVWPAALRANGGRSGSEELRSA